jgi:hypothetical protein
MATTFEQMFPLWQELMLEARIQFLVKLGPEFRAGLLEWEKLERSTSQTVSEEIKKEYCNQEGPRLLMQEEGYGGHVVGIFDIVREILESEGYAKKEWLATS